MHRLGGLGLQHQHHAQHVHAQAAGLVDSGGAAFELQVTHSVRLMEASATSKKPAPMARSLVDRVGLVRIQGSVGTELAPTLDLGQVSPA